MNNHNENYPIFTSCRLEHRATKANHQEVISRLRERCRTYREIRQGVMFQLKEMGLTYQTIGNMYGLSRQRIHQVVGKYLPWEV